MPWRLNVRDEHTFPGALRVSEAARIAAEMPSLRLSHEPELIHELSPSECFRLATGHWVVTTS